MAASPLLSPATCTQTRSCPCSLIADAIRLGNVPVPASRPTKSFLLAIERRLACDHGLSTGTAGTQGHERSCRLPRPGPPERPPAKGWIGSGFGRPAGGRDDRPSARRGAAAPPYSVLWPGRGVPPQERTGECPGSHLSRRRPSPSVRCAR